MGFTEKQLEAINTHGKDILVSAAAGSGKTSVLVERIMQMLLQEKDPASIDSILIVTFTQAATGEMRTRISKALNDLIKKYPDNKHLVAQVPLLQRASIMTIDAFCNSVVKRNFTAVDVDPNYRTGDATEITLLSNQVLDEYFEELYENDDETLLELIDTYCDKGKDENLKKLINNINTAISSQSNPDKWLDNSIEIYNVNSEEEYFNSDMFKNIIELGKNDVLPLVKEYYKSIDDLFDKFDINKSFKFYVGDKNLLIDFENALNNSSPKAIFDFSANLSFASRVGQKAGDSELNSIIGSYRDAFKTTISDYMKFFDISIEELIKQSQWIYTHLKGFVTILKEYRKRLFELKKVKGIFDFNDIAHLCHNILIDENGNPTNEAKAYQKKYTEIIIDEFQDSNFLQCDILTAVSRKTLDTPNMFMVGDIKQCIYVFRNANPDMFNEKYKSFKADKTGKSVRIDLNQNFRSRDVVIDFVNFIFSQTMSEKVGGVEYDNYSKLYLGADYPEPKDPNIKISDNTEFYILDSSPVVEDNLSEEEKENLTEYQKQNIKAINDISKTELEANFIANRIQKLFDENFHVYDRAINSYRPIEYKDIVILMRSTKDRTDSYLSVFNQHSIPCYCAKSSGFFDTPEIQTIMSLLSIIDNPKQDIPLIAVLHSPIYSFNANELLEIRLNCKYGYFYDAIKNFVSSEQNNFKLKEKLEKFLNDLTKWARLSINIPISELLYILYSETDYYSYVGLLPNGKIRQTNLENLCNKAQVFENAGLTGLYRFIAFIEESSFNDKDGETNITSEDENLVRIMTIHKSKGLEFPVVFFSNLAKRPNNKTNAITYHSKYGLATNLTRRTTKDDFEETTIAEELEFFPPKITHSTQYLDFIKAKNSIDGYSEELRNCYVALTRAKEKLILVATDEIKKDTFSKNYSQIIWDKYKITQNLTGNFTTFYKLFCMALARHSSAIDTISEENLYIKNAVEDTKENQPPLKIEIVNRLNSEILFSEKSKKLTDVFNDLKLKCKENINQDLQKVISSRLGFIYPYKLDFTIPSTISISEIKRNHHNEILSDENLAEPLFNKNEFKDNKENEDKEETFSNFELPDFYKSTEEISTGAFIGTAIHTLMEHLDFNYSTEAEIKSLIAKLLSDGILNDNQANIISVKKIIKFLNSSLCQRLRKSPKIYRETPFVMGMTPYEVFNQEEYKNSYGTVLVHGIIDLYFEEDNNIILVDYKTDKVTNKQTLVDNYKIQLDLYKKALEKNTGKKVTETMLYLFSIDEILNI